MNFSLLVLAVAAFTSFSATPMADDVSVAMRSEDHITLWKLVQLLAAATTFEKDGDDGPVENIEAFLLE
ncbi:hypothetical protein CCHR01_10534 [Colletotrichum chrysophilum]|uniref:Uncharacterized protein n=1 Tax=Colletotrichum chrysophilum TaxID=1836956 RepID=A0AAD9AES8_9PEZI|nr:hypothetical protein CCHR01_10534 [Colletotrichum chrysophilum]